MFNLLKGFLPWILYSVFYGQNTKQFITAILVALISSFIFNWKEVKGKFVLTWVTLIYFALLLMLTLTTHWAWLQNETWLISNIVLALMAFGSYLIKQPFTFQYAKLETEEKYWKNPVFIEINNILTNIWGIIFLLTAVVNYFYSIDPDLNKTSYFILSNIGWVIGLYINKKFPAFWKNYVLSRKEKSPFLRGNFAPWRSEDHFENLEVEGKIPEDLNGILLRNGPNPRFDPIGFYHWFSGDGMLHAIRIKNGKASYDNRWVQTERFKLEKQAGKPLFNMGTPSDKLDSRIKNVSPNTANTNIVFYNQTLLALNEGALPVEIKTQDLSTVGDFTYHEKIKRRLTAHPRFDYKNKELLTYSYMDEDKQLIYYRIDQNNQVLIEKNIAWPYSAMMHDFVTTENYIIFPVFPCTYDFERKKQGEPLFIWEGDCLKTFFIVTDKNGNEITRFEMESCYVYHFANAYEQDGKIIIDSMMSKASGLMPDRNGNMPLSQDGRAYLTRIILDLKNQTTEVNRLDDASGEFPRFDERFNGLPYQHLYVAGDAPKDEALFNRIMHYDLISHSKEEHFFGQDIPTEPVFVPRSAKEGDGYLLIVVYRSKENRSDIVILDAMNVAEKPLATIKIPHRIPYGFHGNFVAD